MESTPRGRSRPPDDPVAAGLALARDLLGPACELALASPESQVLLLSRIRRGQGLEDAVLAVAHRAAAEDRAVANEFVAHFLSRLQRIGRASISPGLRRYLDTGDLVQSVLGSLWPEILALRFESSAQFLSYLGQRMRWRASDEQRKAASRQRDGAEQGPPEDGVDSAQRGPMTQLIDEEEIDRIALVLPRLSERDRALLRLHLGGASTREASKELGLLPDTARKALRRALRRAKRYLQ